MDKNETETCSTCGETIDLMCHCGEPPSGPSHGSDWTHSFVSFNKCLCARVDELVRERVGNEIESAARRAAIAERLRCQDALRELVTVYRKHEASLKPGEEGALAAAVAATAIDVARATIATHGKDQELSNEELEAIARSRGMKLVPASADLNAILRDIIRPRVADHQANEARVRALPYDGSDLVAIYSARCDEAEQIERLIQARVVGKEPPGGGQENPDDNGLPTCEDCFRR